MHEYSILIAKGALGFRVKVAAGSAYEAQEIALAAAPFDATDAQVQGSSLAVDVPWASYDLDLTTDEVEMFTVSNAGQTSSPMTATAAHDYAAIVTVFGPAVVRDMSGKEQYTLS